MRTFLALTLPPISKAELLQAQKSLQAQLPARGVRWVSENQFHLTVFFLGDSTPAQVQCWGDSFGKLAKTAPLPELFKEEYTLAGYGAFPSVRRANVVWAGLRGNLSALSALQQTLAENARQMGYTLETRRFQAHITLGRVERTASAHLLERLQSALQPAIDEKMGSFRFTSLSLYQSTLQTSGAIYRKLAQIVPG